MNTINKAFLLFSLVVICTIVSCSKEQANDPTQGENLTSKMDSEFRTSIIEKVGQEKANELFEQIYNPSVNNSSRAPISYTGELCNGVVNPGVASGMGCCDFANADWWHFSANLGDAITIEVDRVNCNMDPIMALYEGFGDDNILNGLTSEDDGDAPACTPGCPSFSDPLLSGFIIPSTGVYTVAVWDFFNGACLTGTMDYEITITGLSTSCVPNTDSDGDGCDDSTDPHPNSDQTTTVIIDGCDSGIANVFVTQCSTMSDLIADCAVEAIIHGDFVSCVTHLTNEWKTAGHIVANEKGDIVSCAAQADIP